MEGSHEVPAPVAATSRRAVCSSTVEFPLEGSIDRVDIPELCAQLQALLNQSAADVVLCDVSLAEPDAVTIDAIARLQLTARRRGRQIYLLGPPEALSDLVALAGLSELVAFWTHSSAPDG